MTNHRPPPPPPPLPHMCTWKALSLLLSNQAASAANHRPAGVCLTMWDVKERTVAVAAGGGLGGATFTCPCPTNAPSILFSSLLTCKETNRKSRELSRAGVKHAFPSPR